MKRQLIISLLTAIAPAAIAIDLQNGSGETDGYKLVWQDLFDADELNPERWFIEVNGDGGGNSELQYYTDNTANVCLGKDDQGNGCLILTAIRENYNGKSFTSGRINSKNRIAFKHGKIEASIKLPKTANGLWPAFWMMGNDYDAVGWPKCGETDIMEFGHATGIANNSQDRYFNGACHWGQGWPAGSHANSVTKSYSLQDGEFHLYTLIWDENQIAMYVDLDRMPIQTPYFKMGITADNPDDEWSPGNYFHKENFILFNLAVGGNFPGIWNPAGITALNDDNDNRASMYVNYVKIYQKGTTDESQFFMNSGDEINSTGIETANSNSNFDISISGTTITVPAAATITVYDITGRLIASETDTPELSTEHLPHGIYVVHATTAYGLSITKKIIL